MSISVLLYAILTIAAIGAAVGWSNAKKGAAWGQPLTIACAILAIGVGFYLALANSGIVGNQNAGTQKRETEYQKIQTRELGKYLAEKFSGQTAILVKDPNTQDDNPTIVGLKEGLGTAITITDEVSPTAPKSANRGPEGGPEEMMEPIENWYKKKDLEKILANKKADLIITTIGLPDDVFFTGKAFNTKCLEKKKVAIAGGNISRSGKALQGGAVVAAVTYNPKAEYDDKPIPKDPKAAFDKRFILITSENFKQVYSENKELFQY